MIKTEPLLSVTFFMTQSGNEPVRDWLRAMETDLWEARSNLAHGNISRVFFTIYGGQMILLHGFIKKAQKTQKTPKKEIDQARRRTPRALPTGCKNEWFKEVKNNE